MRFRATITLAAAGLLSLALAASGCGSSTTAPASQTAIAAANGG